MSDIKSKVEIFINHLQMEFLNTENTFESQLNFLQKQKPELDRLMTKFRKEAATHNNFSGNTEVKEVKAKKKKKSKEIKIVLYKFRCPENPTTEIVEDFLWKTINVQVKIKNTARLGKANDSPILITLENKADRKMIYRNLKNFKKFHDMGEKYSICDESTKYQQEKEKLLNICKQRNKESVDYVQISNKGKKEGQKKVAVDKLENDLREKYSHAMTQENPIMENKGTQEQKIESSILNSFVAPETKRRASLSSNKLQNNASEKIAKDVMQEETGTEKLIIASRENNSEDMTQDFRILTLDQKEPISSCIVTEKKRRAPPPPSTTILKNTDTTPVNQQKSSYENAEHANVSMISSHLKRNFSSLKNKIFKIN